MNEKILVNWLKNYSGRPLRLMEVCGTHTSALYRTGIKQLLPRNIQLISGPGCPVCVTPSAYIDKLIDYSYQPNCCVLSFADMLSVPGSQGSLASAKANGGSVDFFYTPEQALEKAKQAPNTLFILAAVGFETTAPIWATVILETAKAKLPNVKFLTALKTMPAAINSLCDRSDIDGFLCPGHVAVITGTKPFQELSKANKTPMVIGGFTSSQLLAALTRLVLEASKGSTGLWNEYISVVKENGNEKASQLINQVFSPGTALWRGLGALENSGLFLQKEFQDLDAGSFNLTQDKLSQGCQCTKVLLGQLLPHECPCFGKVCTPEHPVGACMVSGEGTCCITYREGDF